MARKKLEIKATDEQLDRMYLALKAGATLEIALKSAGIGAATYYYWVAISSIVTTVKSQEEVEDLEAMAKSGVPLSVIKELAANSQSKSRTSVGSYIEPTQEGILQYKNNTKFRKFANRCYEIVTECDKIRSDFAIRSLIQIQQSTKDKKINPSGAMWWLERSLPDSFAKPSDKAKENENSRVATEPIRVEFIDPNTATTKERLMDMEREVLEGLKKDGEA